MTKDPTHDTISSGHHVPYWLFSELVPLDFEQLRENLTTDVVIVGGGITGLSIAYQLLKTGKRVVVVEDGYIGSGESGRTSAHLTNALDDRYYILEKTFGKDHTKLIAQSHTEAIRFIEYTAKTENIECEFERVSGYLFLHPSDKEESILKEYEAAKNAGLDVKMHDQIPGMKQQQGPCIEFKNQGQFHPVKYLKGLCKAIREKGGQIYTLTHAQEITEKGIVTSEGFKIDAEQVVVASNAPVNSKYILPMKQFPFRTYVIGATIKKNELTKALWWDTGDHDANADIPPYHYVRIEELDGDYDLLLCGGEDHATGLADAENIPEESRYKLLESWAKAHFNIDEIIYRWSGQIMEPIDSLAYIGKSPMDKDNIYIATGDSGNGLTHGTIAGMLIADLINGTLNRYENIYSPSRITMQGIQSFLKEFVPGLISYIKHKPGSDELKVNDIAKNEGKVIEWKGKKCGIYRDPDDFLHIVDAECSHLKCIIKWNNDEKSWDCPCHGSRFTPEGKVMNGPANTDLPHHLEKLKFNL
jgi:glycine/D-amino acid oxidase-like deaminating enzyme/nitrite reductase/ring-hydroxylating ferredoxin subunit